jgi:hypothetical protein
MRHREPLKYITNESVCVEIGVWKGDFSKQILNMNPKKLILIDPWEFQPKFAARMYGGSVAKNQKDMDNIYHKVMLEIGNESNVEIMRGKSNSVYLSIEDNTIDWVYIDGNHEYDFVLEDLGNYYSKVKKGGFITGDDYTWRNPRRQLTVKNAVTDFTRQMGLSVEIFGGQFIIRK